MAADDARARIAAQADDAARRAAADVWLDNSGAPGDLEAAVDVLWHRASCRSRATCGTAVPCSRPPPIPSPPTRDGHRPGRGSPSAWASRRRAAQGPPTSARPPCPGCRRPTSSTCTSPSSTAADPAAVRGTLDGPGPPPPDGSGCGRADGPAVEWRHAGTDPGRPVRVHVSPAGSRPGAPRSCGGTGCVHDARRARSTAGGGAAGRGGGAARRRFEDDAVTRAEDWAAASGWSPPSGGGGAPDATSWPAAPGRRARRNVAIRRSMDGADPRSPVTSTRIRRPDAGPCNRRPEAARR